ncbi:hypothetical protein N3Z17_00725 [Candidatus Bandiella numerosa]|uniref:hypothetical protein n=1 Tax=Candidatus Bandiella numerosa TaxID=2570586 RepID=UPI00249DAD64|nr:hypothetical protein [Candidatus Bandiella numerosa]MBY0580252.1 hypothetical protein [Rickettsiales bacterium]WHA05072.1 hypothetical protein N3Z17_00725 [Candidatus Bandiella numerosa]
MVVIGKISFSINLKASELIILKKLLLEIKEQKFGLFSEKVIDIEIYKNLAFKEKFVLDALNELKN